MTHKNRKKLINFISEVLDVLFWGLKASPVAWTSFMEAYRYVPKLQFLIKQNLFSSKFFSIFGHQNPRSRSGFDINAGSRSELNESGSATTERTRPYVRYLCPVSSWSSGRPAPGRWRPNSHRTWAWRPASQASRTTCPSWCSAHHYAMLGIKTHLSFSALKKTCTGSPIFFRS